VRVLNSKRPEGDGTLITNTTSAFAPCIVKSIAYKEHITIITVQSTRMLMAHGFLARLFEVFAQHHKSIDVIATSEVGVSLTIDNADNLESILAELRQFAEVRVEPGKAVVCLVGEGMKPTRGIAARLFAALDQAGVNVELISHGGSEINLTFVISEAQIAATVKCLHDEFFANVAQWQEVFE
jgi:aspartate kinase